MLKKYQDFKKIYENKGLRYTSDDLRCEAIQEFLDEVKGDDTWNLEEPDMDELLDPYDGYNKQTYIQNDLKNNQIIYWEGWSSFCWEGAYSKQEYKGLDKDKVLEKIIKERFPIIASEMNMEMVAYEFFWQEAEWKDQAEDGYIMKITLRKKD